MPGKFTVRPFHPYDLSAFKLDDIAEQVIVVSTILNVHDTERCYTGFLDGKPIVFAGIDMIKRSVYGRGLGEAWIYIKPDLPLAGLRNDIAFKLVWKFNELIKRDRYYRLQAECRREDFITRRLLERLGFSLEAMLKNASEKERDTCLYARTSGENAKHIVPERNQKTIAREPDYRARRTA